MRNCSYGFVDLSSIRAFGPSRLESMKLISQQVCQSSLPAKSTTGASKTTDFMITCCHVHQIFFKLISAYISL